MMQRRTFLGFLGGVLGLGAVGIEPAKISAPFIQDMADLKPVWRRTVTGNGMLVMVAAQGIERVGVHREVRVVRPGGAVLVGFDFNGNGGSFLWRADHNLQNGLVYAPEHPLTVEVPVAGVFRFSVLDLPTGKVWVHTRSPDKPGWIVSGLTP